MRPSTKEDRDARRQLCEEQKYPLCRVQHQGKSFDYYLMPAKKLPADLQLGIMQLTPTLEEWERLERNAREIFFVLSDAVPEVFRRYWVLHELIEYLPNVGGIQLECHEAAQAEVNIMFKELTSPLQKEYLALRLEFFRDLVAYGKKHEFDPKDIESFEHSLKFFYSMAGQKRIAE